MQTAVLYRQLTDANSQTKHTNSATREVKNTTKHGKKSSFASAVTAHNSPPMTGHLTASRTLITHWTPCGDRGVLGLRSYWSLSCDHGLDRGDDEANVTRTTTAMRSPGGMYVRISNKNAFDGCLE